jgi:hypothetical protein
VTRGERQLWRMIYATSWHETGWRLGPGVISGEERARWAVGQADRVVEALRAIASEGSAAAEVLR